jgi:hypothetical protein
VVAASLCVEFGYLPEERNFSVGDITISTLPRGVRKIVATILA